MKATVRALDLSELLGDDEPEAVPMPEATADTFLEVFARYCERHAFEPGCLVIYKDGLDPRMEHLRGQPMLFVQEGIDGWRAQDRGTAALLADCVVMYRGGADAVFYFANRQTLRPWVAPHA